MPRMLTSYGNDVFRSIVIGIVVGIIGAFAWNPFTGVFVAIGSIVLMTWPFYL